MSAALRVVQQRPWRRKDFLGFEPPFTQNVWRVEWICRMEKVAHQTSHALALFRPSDLLYGRFDDRAILFAQRIKVVGPSLHHLLALVWLFLVKWIFMVRGAERERELVASMPQRAMCIASQ
ncbi:hypothetical protein [Variovorax boronicumulans]|nr:hypothetical protein [Variovorax boronicumulans]